MKSPSQLAIEALDQVARAQELTWGVNRLPALVASFNPNLAAKFYSQAAKLNAALEDQVTGGGWEANEAVIREAARMQTAWARLAREAEAAGCEPLSPAWFEGRLPDGRLLIVARDVTEAHRLAGDNRQAVVWSMEEICRVLWNFEMVNDAKTVWPGAKVEEVRVNPEHTKPPVNWKMGDRLPETMMAG